MRALKLVGILIAAILLVLIGFVYTGMFNAAADEPHWRVTHRVIEWARDRAIAVGARDLEAPPLDDAELLAHGAEEYEGMCTGCHLAPGMRNTPLRQGLYPSSPNLAERGTPRSAAETFWIIKHGLKMTGMPAWGLTHDDRSIWSMVALLQKLPELSVEEYRELLAQDGESHTHSEDAEEGPAHSHGEAQLHAMTSAVRPRAAQPAAVVDRFFRELAAGNTDAAGALLDPRVLVFESGGAERSREEYAAHHLASDAQFLKRAQHRLLARTGDAVGDLAWVASEARLSGRAGGKPLDLMTTETMVLRRTPQGWRIAHIHWSNQPAEEGS